MKINLIRKITAFFLTITLIVIPFTGCFSVGAVGDSASATQSDNYNSNKGSLQSNSFIELPLGSVQASGWLLDQLNLQKNGITGAMEEYDNYNSNSEWLGGSVGSWEKSPYYVRGLVALAYTLQDEELITKAQKWIDWSLNSQRSDGFFGPVNNTDWWPLMPMLMAIRDYYEATENLGTPDARVIPFLEKYFRYQLKALPSRPLSSWAQARGGDNLEVVLWLYNYLYDENSPADTDWLIELAKILINQTTDWTNMFNTTTAREHVVNTSEALKEPVLKYLITGTEQDKSAFSCGLLNISIDHGRVDGLPNADESASDNKPTRGTELCGIVENMLSTEIAIAQLGEASFGDQLERVAYNSLPAAYAPDYLGANYFVCQNNVLATAGNHEFSTDHGDDTTYGAPCGYECCFPNNHMGWPKFVQSMWMATNDNGLAAIAYGPNKISAKVADGKTAVFTQDTNYPFDEAIVLNYSGETAEFPLELRIPEWCDSPVIKVNGVACEGAVSGEFFRIFREWRAGDSVEITFPMNITVSNQYSGAVSVERGALIYSLNVGEEWVENTDPEIRQMNIAPAGGLLAREVYPTTPWNYGLVVDENNPESSFTVEQREMTEQPYSSDTAPVVLKAKGQLIPEWQLDGNIVGDISFGTVALDESKTSEIELVPFACTRLRITQFPKVGDTKAANSYKTVRTSETNGTKIQEIKNVVVPEALDYRLTVNYTGSGSLSFVVNNHTVSNVNFDGSSDYIYISSLKSAVSGESFAFNENHINNIRFVGNDGVTVTGISVTSYSTANSINIESVVPGDGSFTVNSDLNRETAQYYIHYGTESGKYDVTASGFHGSSATITGLASGTYYFYVEAMLNGKTVVTKERSVTVNSNEEKPDEDNGVSPEAAITDNFSDAAASDKLWTKYGTVSKINVSGGKLVFGSDGNVKSVINGGESWTDYVVETKITLTEDKEYNNAGLMLRVSSAASGPDAYHGYYFGIRRNQAVIGYADGGWHSTKDVNCTISYNKEYTLKAILSGDKIAYFIDGEPVYCMSDNMFANGSVGLRSYEEAFTADDFTVRALTDSDKTDLVNAFGGKQFKLTARRYCNTVQVRYPVIGTAASYKIMYGTEAGVYTNEVYDHYYNSFTGGSAGTTAVSVPDDGQTYYVKAVALNGSAEVGESEEIVVTPFKFNAPQNVLSIDASSADSADGIITGLDSTMEYRAEGSDEYIKCTSDSVNVNAGKYYVRRAAAGSVRASDEVEIVVGVAQKILPGDLDFDGKITVSDVVTLRRLIMAGQFTDAQFSAGNIDGDDKITVSDVVALRRLIMSGV